MDTKLTLKLDSSVIEFAKTYAEEHKRSLSKLVEDYFNNLASEKKSTSYSPLVEELSGVISEKDAAYLDYISYLEKKYD